MSLITSTVTSTPLGATTGPADAALKGREALKPLAKALRSGDVDAAKTAYAQIVKDAPAGATFQPGSPFAEMGKALRNDDIEAARTAFGAMVRGVVKQPPSITLPPMPSTMPLPVASTTGGTAGSTLNAVA